MNDDHDGDFEALWLACLLTVLGAALAAAAIAKLAGA